MTDSSRSSESAEDPGADADSAAHDPEGFHPVRVDVAPDAVARDTAAQPPVSLKTQIVRFIITGAGSGVVDFGLTVLLMHVGLSHTAAKAIGFICGTTTAYVLNRRWTFRAPPSAVRLLSVAVLYAITFSVQVGLFDVMFSVLPKGIVYTFAAYCVAQGTATVINFVVQHLVIFRLKDARAEA